MNSKLVAVATEQNIKPDAPLGELQHDGRRIVGAAGIIARGHAADIVHAAGKLDHVVERMNADGGECAARRLLGRRAPIVERDELRGRSGVLRHHRDDTAEASVLRALAQLAKLG